MRCARCGATARDLRLWVQIAGMTGREYVCCYEENR